MKIGGLDTGVAAAQLSNLFDVEAIFKRRGRRVAAYEDPKKLLFDPTAYDAHDKYYPIFGSSSLRRILGLIINGQRAFSVEEIVSNNTNLSIEKIMEVLSRGVQLGLLTLKDSKYTSSRSVGFGSTFEWYVAAVCMVELSSIAYWGVEVENLTGDYDVVVVRENKVGYIECKSGKLSNIDKNHIINFLERERVLAPQFSVYLVDGISRENLTLLVNFALEQRLEYDFEMPGVMDTSISLNAEHYKNFVRLIPINSFFVSVENSVATSLREIYEFLTLVCDRTLPTENMAARGKFR